MRSNTDVYTSQTIRLTIIFNEKKSWILGDILDTLLNLIYLAGPTNGAPPLAMPHDSRRVPPLSSRIAKSDDAEIRP